MNSANPRATTVAGLVKAATDAAAGVASPLPHTPLRPEAARFWPGIIEARARDEWDAVGLALAAQLAECQCAIEEESALLRAEGSIIKGERGCRVNPRAKLLDALVRRELALMRSLRMGGRVVGAVRDLMGKRLAEARARALLDDLRSEGGLLA